MDSETIKAMVLGVVQGITEFFPVSSTAHLILFPWFFHWGGELNTLVFDVALHAGTLAALMLCFYRDWLDMLARDRKTLFFIIAATIPAGAAGVLFHHAVENALRSPLLIALFDGALRHPYACRRTLRQEERREGISAGRTYHRSRPGRCPDTRSLAVGGDDDRGPVPEPDKGISRKVLFSSFDAGDRRRNPP